ncbi:MAG: carboxypeptidase-like regulatory protein [Mucilaginibacter sp.]|nr:carboxypeptidase-like regulatory protein [Mucilaginibacter sp.]
MTINRKLITHAILLFIPIVFCTKLYAQGNLMKEVSIGEIKQQPMSSVLDKIASKGNFYFAYNNKTIPADSIVSVSGYRGTLFSLLDKLLGDTYEFKEVPGYIVLRHAPNRLFITAEVEKDQGKQTLVKGHINNVANQRYVARASVYEKNLLISTLTDDNGYFELKLKNWTGSILLTVSKENYRDTSLYVLPEVNIDSKHNNNKKYKYYPDEGSGSDGVQHSRFARFFIGSKQLVQGLNLGNFFASSPYQISLAPGLSTHGMYNSQIVDHVSLNIWGGYTAGIDGFEMAGVFNINRKDMSFFQVAGVFNFVGGSTKGIQLAGIFNNVQNNASGAQVAGIINRAHNFTGGVQMAGIVNIDQQASGFQVAGAFNSTQSFNGGVQMAGLFNNSEKSKGMQLASIFNRSAGETGSQFSAILNIAKKVKGFQFALVNIADSSDYAIGVLNFIRNGEKSIALSTDESFYTHLDFRSGGRVLYSLLGFAYQFGNYKSKYAFDIGFGAHIINHSKFSLNTEYTSQVYTDFKNKLYQTNSIKVLPGYKFNKFMRLFAGPSINLTSAEIGDEAEVHGWILHRHLTDKNINTLFIGVTGGLQFSW